MDNAKWAKMWLLVVTVIWRRCPNFMVQMFSAVLNVVCSVILV